MCRHTEDANCPHKGLLFVCQNPECRHTLYADLIGPRNVTMRTLLVRQDWIRTGLLSMAADASTVKPKRHACEGLPRCGGDKDIMRIYGVSTD
jgi:hypothetical protein